jgi:hypothetical protein
MEELSKEELLELVAFYKQRCSDVEFNVLKTQLKLNYFINLISKSEEVAAAPKASPSKKTG